MRGILLNKHIFYFNQYKCKTDFFLLFRLYSTKKQKITRSQVDDVINNQSEIEIPKPQQLMKVAIIGAPNAGKSSFINTLTNHRIRPTSRKVHTTQNQSQTIYTKDNLQLILFDTPGLTTVQENKKYNLGDKFLRECNNSILNSDLIAVIHDVSNSHTRNVLHPTVLESLITHKTIPSVLVLNKIDLIRSKRILLDLVRILTEGTLICRQRQYLPWKGREEKFIKDMQRPIKYKNEKSAGWPYFSDVFMISSLTGDGFGNISNYLSNKSTENAWEYPDYQFTDQRAEDLIVENVRATLLEFLPQEIPYNLQCEMELFEVKNRRIFAHVNIHAESKRLERLVSGSENKRLKQISEIVASNIIQLYNVNVSITLNVTSKDKPKIKKLLPLPGNRK